MKRSVCTTALLLYVLATFPRMHGQSVTGQISGTVADAAGAVIPGAAVTLTSDLSLQVHSFKSEANGSFVFTNLAPGNYSLRITQPGFKVFAQNGITVSAQERVDLHELKLTVGDVSSTVEVKAESVHVATDSSERSIAISLRQVEDTPTRGRNPVSLVMTLPGVQTLASNDYRVWSGGGIPAINGRHTGQVMPNRRRASRQHSGNLNPRSLSPRIDSL